MTRFRRRLPTVLVVALAAVHLGCGSDSLVLPAEGDATSIAIMDGDDQSGPAGGTLPQPLVVRVTDARGRPVADQDVTFTPDAGAGSAAPTTAKTDADGMVSSVWTLGPAAGTQQLVAKATGGTAPANLSTTFSATAVSGSAAALQRVSGDGQSGAVGSALPESLVVKVTDGQGNPVAGVEVSWTVSGGGSISPDKVTTGTDGRAAAERVLGPTSGGQTAQASAAGLSGSPVAFSHTAVPANPTSLVKVSGDLQSAPAGFALADSLVVRLVDPNGNGVGGRSVTWVVGTGEGSVNPVNSVTTPQGYASTSWTMPATAGAYSIDAVYSGLLPVGFSATATPDAPSTLAMVSGDGQSATVGSALPQPLRVKVADANGNAVENVSVTWTANGGGSVNGNPTANTSTGSDGIAQVTRTLGLTPGDYTTTAAVEGLSGSPVTFTSTATIGAPAKLAFLVQPENIVVGQPFSPDIQVEIQDIGGNRVPGATNQVTITSSRSGTLVGTASMNAVAGIATFPGLSINKANSAYTLRAGASGLSSATSGSFDVAKASTTVSITGDTPDPSVVGQPVTIGFNVDIVAPGAGTLSQKVTVTDGSQSCSDNVDPDTGEGSCQISFSSVGNKSLTATYQGDANFNGSSSTPPVSHQVNQASTITQITSDDPDPSTAGDVVTVAFNVAAVSPGGGTPGGNVTVTISGGSESCTATVAAGSCDLTLTTVGLSRTITATYNGTAAYAGSSGTESHTVNAANAPPNAVNDSYGVDEDGTLDVSAPGVLSNDTDAQPLNVSLVTDVSHGTLLLDADGSFTYTPAADFNGTDSFVYQASDGSLTDQATVTITVNPVNDPPSFTEGADQSINVLDGAQSVSAWATAISPGPADESGQTVDFIVTVESGDLLFLSPPEVSADGTLTYTPSGLPGVASISVSAHDDGGTANGGDDTSAAQAFTITINP